MSSERVLKETLPTSSLAYIRRKWLEDPEKDEGIKTPFKTVNLKLGSLRGLVCLQAIPKVGKSTLAMQLGIHAARNGTRVIYIDFENGKREIMKRVCQ